MNKSKKKKEKRKKKKKRKERKEKKRKERKATISSSELNTAAGPAKVSPSLPVIFATDPSGARFPIYLFIYLFIYDFDKG